MSDEEKRAPGNVRRVTARNRKDKLDYGKSLFPPESPLTPDPQADRPEPGEPLPFDEDAFTARQAERFPPLPFDGEEPAAFAAQEAERFPPLPKPGWARQPSPQPDEVAQPDPVPEAPVVAPAPVRPKKRKVAAKAQPKTNRRRGCLYNLLAVLFLALTVGALIYGVYIFQNPYSPLNPLPPATPLPIMITATPLPPTAEAPVVLPSATLESMLTTEEADAPPPPPPPASVDVEPTATYTPLPPEALTEMAPAPTQEQAAGG